jgi:hypothetical protein
MSHYGERHAALERALRLMLRVSRRAVVAQERYSHWSSFGTNSRRAINAEMKRDKALAELEAAETEAREVLDWKL